MAVLPCLECHVHVHCMCAERHFFFVFVSIELLICDETPIKMYFCELLSFNIIIQKNSFAFNFKN